MYCFKKQKHFFYDYVFIFSNILIFIIQLDQSIYRYKKKINPLRHRVILFVNGWNHWLTPEYTKEELENKYLLSLKLYYYFLYLNKILLTIAIMILRLKKKTVAL